MMCQYRGTDSSAFQTVLSHGNVRHMCTLYELQLCMCIRIKIEEWLYLPVFH